MRVAGREEPVGRRVVRILLDREKELRYCLVKAAAQEMRSANDGEREADLGARAQTKRSLGVFDRKLGLVRPVPQTGANVPTAGEARIKGQCAIDQGHHRADVLAEERQRQGGVGEDARVVTGNLEDRRAKSAPLRLFASKSWLRPSMQSRTQQTDAQASAGP